MSHPPQRSNRPSSPRRVARTLGLALPLVAGIASIGSGFARQPASADREPPPRPVAIWPPGPLEVIAAFDRPLDPTAARSMVGRTIAYDESPADRPGSPAESRPAGGLRIVGARLKDDGRTLVLATDPHPRQARYHLPLPGSRPGPATKDDARHTVPYDLSGAEAVWSEGDNPGADPKWTGWWPSLDLDAARRLTLGARPQETGWALLARPGRLAVSGWVRLPTGRATVTIRSTGPIEEALLGDAQASSQSPGPEGSHRVDLTAESRGEPLFFSATIGTGAAGRPFSIRAAYRMAGEPAERPLDRDRLRLPWTPSTNVAATAAPLAIPDLSLGDPARGRTIFRGDQARCSQCHVFRGEGGQVGPDISEIASKGRAEIYRSIAAPSAEIAPDYTTYTVATRDGRVFSGVVRAEGPDSIRVTDTNARATTIGRDQVQEIRPSATSIMPPGLAAALGDSAVRDLIAYLVAPGPAANPLHP